MRKLRKRKEHQGWQAGVTCLENRGPPQHVPPAQPRTRARRPRWAAPPPSLGTGHAARLAAPRPASPRLLLKAVHVVDAALRLRSPRAALQPLLPAVQPLPGLRQRLSAQVLQGGRGRGRGGTGKAVRLGAGRAGGKGQCGSNKTSGDQARVVRLQHTRRWVRHNMRPAAGWVCSVALAWKPCFTACTRYGTLRRTLPLSCTAGQGRQVGGGGCVGRRVAVLCATKCFR